MNAFSGSYCIVFRYSMEPLSTCALPEKEKWTFSKQ